MVKNANYALAESRATYAAASSDGGRLEIAIQSIDSAIAIAPDVGRYPVIRANILDRARNSTAAESDQARLAVLLPPIRSVCTAVLISPSKR